MIYLMRNSRHAFTLFEVLIVVVIIGIATAMAGSGFSLLMKKFTAKAVAHKMRDAIQLARSDAMARSRNNGIALDTATKQWVRFIDNPTSGTIGVLDVLDTLVARDSLPGFGLNSISCTRMTSGVCAVVFTPDGSTINGASLRLAARHSRSNVSFSALIIAATGFSIVEVK
jgi:prepilin-type N-terminal cleavage/methylation domain-containing protein